MNYYEILNVDKGSTEKEIKKAYKILASKYHPDKNVGKSQEEIDKNEKIFKEINEAYSTLSDPEKRKQYDYELEYRSTFSNYSSNQNNGDFSFNFNFNDVNFDSVKEMFKKYTHFTGDEGYGHTRSDFDDLKDFYTQKMNNSSSSSSSANQEFNSNLLSIYTDLGYSIENGFLVKEISVPFKVAFYGGNLNVKIDYLKTKSLLEQTTLTINIKPKTKNGIKLSIKEKGYLKSDGTLAPLHLKVKIVSDDEYKVRKDTVSYALKIPVLDILSNTKKEYHILDKIYSINASKVIDKTKSFNHEEMNMKIQVSFVADFSILNKMSDEDFKLIEQLKNKLQ